MEFSFAFTLFFLVIADSKSQEMTPWGSVQISTCDVPLFDTPFSICCYTENLPNDTIIYFSNNFGHVAKIKPPCRYGVEQHSDNMTSNCNWIGNMKVYYLTIHGKFLQDYVDVTFECGYYVRKRELKITVLDSHTTSVFLPGSSPVLNFKLQNGLASNIRLYLLQSNVTLLEVDQENNVAYHDNDVTFNGNVHQNNFSAKILNLQRQRNGTYVCEYAIANGTTMRDGITVVVLRKPKAPEIRSTTWEVFRNGISGTLTCEGTSDFAAPLFYKPAVAANLMTEWIIPSENDWQGRNISYFSSINGSLANISIFECNETYLLPIYCKVSEKSLVSDKSFGFFPNITCSKLWSAVEHDKHRFTTFVLVIVALAIVIGIAFDVTVIYLIHKRIQAWRRQKTHSLIDGLPSERDFRSDEVQQALEEIAMEESRQKFELHGGQSTGTNTVSPVVQNENEAGTSQLPSSPDSVRGAGGGAPRVEEANDDITTLKEVESLLTSHQRQLGGVVIPLRVSRENILENLIGYYTKEEDLAISRITVKFNDEEGMDCGGVTNDMFTTFWYRAQEEFFIGYEAVVPYLPPQRFTDDSKYQVLGRILSHSIAVMEEFPIHMCKSTIIAMIDETTDVSAEKLFEDFLYFLESHDRILFTTAIHNYGSLTSDQTDELMTIFARYEYAIRLTAENFRYQVTQLARHVLCIRPKPLLDKMRSGIPQSHMERFWSNVHLKTLSVLFRALKPTPERVIARLKTLKPWMNEQQRRVFGFLKDLLKEMTTPEMETFLQFVTGKKSVPRRKIFIKFTRDTGNLRLPKVHTCSNMMELPASYEDYETFRSEFKHLLASGEALKMSMA